MNWKGKKNEISWTSLVNVRDNFTWRKQFNKIEIEHWKSMFIRYDIDYNIGLLCESVR